MGKKMGRKKKQEQMDRESNLNPNIAILLFLQKHKYTGGQDTH